MRSGRLNYQQLSLFAALALLISAGGCSGTQSADQALNKALETAGKNKETVYPFAGKVTIDGQPPKFENQSDRLVVMLNDPEKPDEPTRSKTHVDTNAQGEFNFNSYALGDGLRPGKYILTFAVLKNSRKLGYLGPDQLHNLYNDPDKNAKIPEFFIDHQAPGKRDYAFNLETAGKEEGTPGPHALTSITDEGVPGTERHLKK
jgi:hypothetical protein